MNSDCNRGNAACSIIFPFWSGIAPDSNLGGEANPDSEYRNPAGRIRRPFPELSELLNHYPPTPMVT
jgi:hypothetical protein